MESFKAWFDYIPHFEHPLNHSWTHYPKKERLHHKWKPIKNNSPTYTGKHRSSQKACGNFGLDNYLHSAHMVLMEKQQEKSHCSQKSTRSPNSVSHKPCRGQMRPKWNFLPSKGNNVGKYKAEITADKKRKTSQLIFFHIFPKKHNGKLWGQHSAYRWDTSGRCTSSQM